MNARDIVRLRNVRSCSACGFDRLEALVSCVPVLCAECHAKERGVSPVELHHFFSRNASPLTIPLGANAHRILTAKQRAWPINTLRNPAGEERLRAAAFLRSFSDAFAFAAEEIEREVTSETALDAYIRAHCQEVKTKQEKPGNPKPKRELPLLALVLDVETLADCPSQRLTFGSYAVLARSADAKSYDPAPIESALFFGDGKEGVPDQFPALLAECAAACDPGSVPPRVISQTEFLEVLYRYGVEDQSLVVGYNLAFDLSRIARSASFARNRRGTKNSGGFSFVLWPDKKRRPRLVIKSLGPRKSKYAFSSSGGFDTEEDARAHADQRMEWARNLVRRVEAGKEDKPDKNAPVDYKRFASALLDVAPRGRSALGRRLVEEFVARYGGGKKRGRFLDVSTLVATLTDRGYSLKSACEAFTTTERPVQSKGSTEEHPGWAITPEYVAYNFGDVISTCELLDASLRRYAEHPVDLEPDRAYSAATLGKSYFRGMGITPMLDRWGSTFPLEVLGIAASTYHGGSTGVAYRRCIVPVKYVDFLSMYSTVNVLLGTDALLRASDCEINDCTEEVNALLSTVTDEELFKPSVWKRLSFFGEVFLDGSGVFPVRAVFEQGDAARIGFCHVRAEEPRWYAGPDIVGSFILSGARPKVRRAFRVEPKRDEDGNVLLLDSLRSIDLLGHVRIDPRTDNVFKKVIEERQRAKRDKSLPANVRKMLDTGLKVFANGTGYGIFGEVNVDQDEVQMTVHSAGERLDVVNENERPGEYNFMPVAAHITAGAHLMLALLEREVKARGGSIAAWDTDSSAIIATERGGRIDVAADDEEDPVRSVHALSWAQVRSIVERFEELNPYDRDAVPGSVLKVEDVNFVDFDAKKPWRDVFMYAVSSKRYCMFEMIEGEPSFLRTADGKYEGVKESALGAKIGPAFAPVYDRSTREPLGPSFAPRTGERMTSSVPPANLGEWAPLFWDVLVRRALRLDEDTPHAELWSQHVIGAFPVKTAHVWKAFAAYNAGKDYDASVKPFGFGCVPNYTTALGRKAPPRIFGPKVARCDMFPEDQERTPFFDTQTGERRAPMLELSLHRDEAPVSTFFDVLRSYAVHPESKLALPNGEPCGSANRRYAGPLFRRSVFISGRRIIGKESTTFENDVLQAAGGFVVDHIEKELAPPAQAHKGAALLALVPVDRLKVGGTCRKRRRRVVGALREGCAGTSAVTVKSCEAAMMLARDPKEQARMIGRRLRALQAQARQRIALVGYTVKALGGIVADEVYVKANGKWARCGMFAAVLPRYRSKVRAGSEPVDGVRQGNAREILASARERRGRYERRRIARVRVDSEGRVLRQGSERFTRASPQGGCRGARIGGCPRCGEVSRSRPKA